MGLLLQLPWCSAFLVITRNESNRMGFSAASHVLAAGATPLRPPPRKVPLRPRNRCPLRREATEQTVVGCAPERTCLPERCDRASRVLPAFALKKFCWWFVCCKLIYQDWKFFRVLSMIAGFSHILAFPPPLRYFPDSRGFHPPRSPSNPSRLRIDDWQVKSVQDFFNKKPRRWKIAKLVGRLFGSGGN